MNAKLNFWFCTGVLVAMLAGLTGCSDPSAEAIRAVIAEDARLGEQCRQGMKLDPKDAVSTYVKAMSLIDITRCPDDFNRAFLRHRNAWSELLPLLTKYEGFWGGVTAFMEGFGGDAHYGEEKLERINREIKASWLEVELIASRYGVSANSPQE